MKIECSEDFPDFEIPDLDTRSDGAPVEAVAETSVIDSIPAYPVTSASLAPDNEGVVSVNRIRPRPKGGSRLVYVTYVPPNVYMGVAHEQCNQRQNECMTVSRHHRIDVKA